MPSEENENAESENVGTTDTAEAAEFGNPWVDKAADAPRVDHIPLLEQVEQVEIIPTQHVRIGGSAAVRVTHSPGGVTEQKRVTAIDAPALGDHKLVPLAVLAQVRALLDERPLSVHLGPELQDLLGPWL